MEYFFCYGREYFFCYGSDFVTVVISHTEDLQSPEEVDSGGGGGGDLAVAAQVEFESKL
jgi:hypothetical protein